MKKHIKIVTAISMAGFLCFGTVSCEKFLTENPRTGNSLDNVDTPEWLDMLLTGAYGRLQNCYAVNLLAIGVAGTDEAWVTLANQNAAPVDNYSVNPTSPGPNNFWNSHFTVVREANNVISAATDMSSELLNDEQRLSILSQARFLRAWAYSRLMMAFGELPLIDHAVKTIGEKEFSYGRTPIKDIFKFIESDFLYCIDNEGLPAVKNGGRANLWAAKALLAKLYLYAGTSKHRNEVGAPAGVRYDVPLGNAPAEFPAYTGPFIPGYNLIPENYNELYEKAQELLDDIVENGGFSLTGRFYEPFLHSQKNTNTESIWEIQYSTDPGYGSPWSKQFGILAGNRTTAPRTHAIAGNQTYKPTPGFWKYYKYGDKRRDINIANFQLVLEDNGSFVSKDMIFDTKRFALTLQNPANGANTTVNINQDLNYDKDTLFYAASHGQHVNGNIGTMKYSWGTSDEPANWEKELMSYTMDNCPNNVVVIRFADVLLMSAEVEMLLGGANPSQPGVPGTANGKAIERVNRIMGRGMDYASHEILVAEYTDILNTRYEAELVTYNTARTRYEGNNNNTNYIPYITASLKLSDTKYKLANVEQLTAKLYDEATFTYEMLIDERARELCFEMHRWFDLQRLGWIQYKVLARRNDFSSYPLPDIGVNLSGGVCTIDNGRYQRPYLYPLPLSDTDMSLNPDFKNNPGY